MPIRDGPACEWLIVQLDRVRRDRRHGAVPAPTPRSAATPHPRAQPPPRHRPAPRGWGWHARGRNASTWPSLRRRRRPRVLDPAMHRKCAGRPIPKPVPTGVQLVWVEQPTRTLLTHRLVSRQQVIGWKATPAARPTRRPAAARSPRVPDLAPTEPRSAANPGLSARPRCGVPSVISARQQRARPADPAAPRHEPAHRVREDQHAPAGRRHRGEQVGDRSRASGAPPRQQPRAGNGTETTPRSPPVVAAGHHAPRQHRPHPTRRP